MLCSIRNLLANFPSKHLGVAGGVFANVRLNRLLAERLGLDEIFIFPTMGDEALPVGSALIYLWNAMVSQPGSTSDGDSARFSWPRLYRRDRSGSRGCTELRRVDGAPVRKR